MAANSLATTKSKVDVLSAHVWSAAGHLHRSGLCIVHGCTTAHAVMMAIRIVRAGTHKGAAARATQAEAVRAR